MTIEGRLEGRRREPAPWGPAPSLRVAGERVAVSRGWTQAPPRVAALEERDEARGVARSWMLAFVGAVVLWSLTYLLRQPGVAPGAQPFSLLGDFALEGAFLALAWLGLMLVTCVALLRGAIVVR
jgi:hypothetical protein